MSKIAKFIKSALNNSSANEAAQALKMAAATMQKEGINPAEFLQEKGADNSAEVEALQAELATLYQDATGYLDQIATLNALLAAANKGGNPAELREAKELAIKWHRIAQAQEAHLKELAPIAVKAQDDLKAQQGLTDIYAKRYKFFAVASIVAAVVCWGIGSSNGEDTGRHAQANANWVEMQQKDQKINDLTIQLARAEAAPAKKVSSKATCKIQGKWQLNSNKNDKLTTLKFIYDSGTVTTYRDGKKTDSTEFEGDRAEFLKQVNEAFPGKTDCKLGG
ncbi:hypothetical protein B9R80_002424 [Salmonella enterica]|nr:hypothetical protein [Salmonella enterica]